MPGESKIEWTDATWNPVTGCTEVSPGCDHCYARTFAERFRGVQGHPYEQGFDLKLWPGRLEIPLRWKKPRLVFVNSMSDLFHQGVPDEYILRVFAVMSLADRHTFQVLTKRPDRMMRLLSRPDTPVRIHGLKYKVASFQDAAVAPRTTYPLPNVWIGTSVELQRYSWRIGKLLQTPAAVRFLSCEPLLGPLDLKPYLYARLSTCEQCRDVGCVNCGCDGCAQFHPRGAGINWVITGGESGHGYRLCDPQWVRDVRDQCQSAGVAFFHKQWGGRTPKSGGRILDGRTWDEMPAVQS